MTFDYDLFVIGAGPGGLAASKRAAGYGARVAMVFDRPAAIAEQEAVGGTCVNRGCVPKKLMVYAADFALQDRAAEGYGWSKCQRQLDWSRFTAAMHRHVEQVNQSYLQQFQQAGIELLRGRTTFVNSHTLEIEGRKVTAKKILIAVGGYPLMPKVPGIEHAITSREMFQLPEIPKRLAIIGGGYIGVEFSSVMNALGSQVTLMDTNDQILSGFDDDVCAGVQAGLSSRGVHILTNATAENLEQQSEGLHLSLSSGQDLTVDTVLWATGRAPNTQDLGLDNAGVEVGEKGAVTVDEYSRTSQDNIFAVGDCTNRVPLTPVAKAEGGAFADNEFGDRPQKLSYEFIPSAVFARPEAASVGMTEAQAREQVESVQCYSTQFQPLFDSLTAEESKSLVKLVVDQNTNRVLGAHMVGEHAAEIVQGLAVAVRMGATKHDLEAAFGIHPTTSEEFITLK